MVFWLAVFVGGLFAWIGVRVGFYATWIMLFNLALASYVAVFLTPVIVADVPDATGVAYGHALTYLCVAVATLAIAYGTCFAVLGGQLRMEFPKVLDNTGAGVLGFLAGFLVCSLVGFAFCLTPLSQNAFFKTLGLDARSQATNTSYLCWWCDRLHSFTATTSVKMTSKQAVHKLLKQAGTAPEDQAKPSTLMAPADPKAILPPVPPPPPSTGSAATESDKTPKDSDEAKKDEGMTPGAESTKDQTPDEELSRHRAMLNSPADIQAAVTDSKIWIIEVADKCAAGQFDADQTGLLHDWVSKGGVLWVRNNVLALFGVRYTRIAQSDDALTCIASAGAEVATIVADCKKVTLKDAGGKAAITSSDGVLPLLVMDAKDKSVTARWSLVPYGNKGWISDPKPIDMTQHDGAAFWKNFCRLCLTKDRLAALPRKTSAASAVEPQAPPPAAAPAAPPAAAQRRSYSGTWKTSTGAVLRLEDDGKTITVDLVASDALQILTGRLTRRDDGEHGETTFSGTLDAIFMADAPKEYSINTTMTAGDVGHIHLKCASWPRWSAKGKFLGKSPMTDILTRSDTAPARPIRPDNPFAVPPGQ